jgi:hypothetical protein
MDPSEQQQGSGAQPKSTSEAAPDIKASKSPEVQAARGPDTLAAAVQVSTQLRVQQQQPGQAAVDPVAVVQQWLQHPDQY